MNLIILILFKIHWNEAEPGSYKVYAVYYRPENSDDDFIVKKTTDNEMIIDDLEPNTNYDLALVSANALGHSPFVETKILNAPSGLIFELKILLN